MILDKPENIFYSALVMTIQSGEIKSIHVERLGNIGTRDWREKDYPNIARSYEMLVGSQKGPVSIRHPFRVHPEDFGIRSRNKLICPKITGTVSRNADGVEIVTLKVGDRDEICAPRKIATHTTDGTNITQIDGAIEVGADPEGIGYPRIVHSIIISAFPEDNAAYDRGLAYIRTGDEPTFTFDLNANHGLSAEELTRLHVEAMNKAVDTLKALLDTGI